MNCQFKRDDGTYNVIEGPDAQGRVRIQCLTCSRLWPSKNREPRAVGPSETIKGVGCNPARRAQRLAQSKVQASDRRSASCPERCVNKAAAAQASLLAELHAAILKAKDHALKALLTTMLGQATHHQLPAEQFKQARALAVKQALAEGQAANNPQQIVTPQPAVPSAETATDKLPNGTVPTE